MSVLTVYFCGTGSHRFDDRNPNFWNGELVATLAANDQGREFAHWVAIDGPGSGNMQNDDLFIENKAYGLSGTLFGAGWEQNVAHALQVIKGRCSWQREKLTEEQYNLLKSAGAPIEDVKKEGSWFWRHYDYGDRGVTQQELQEGIIKLHRKGGPIPSQVNIVGWSRGGISCHMLANAMADDPELSQVPVNIFAIDPVPGINNLQPHRLHLRANVREYVGFYSRDERSKGFACVIPATHPDTRTHIYPLSGRHASLVGNASRDGAGNGKHLPEPGLLVRHFAETCLTRWQVNLQKRLALSDKQVADCLDALDRDDARYKDMRGYSYTLICESEGDDRRVHQGDLTKPFSYVRGSDLLPSTGLDIATWRALEFEPIR
ncbi:hypothetical protein GPJ81_22060 [Pseudomonas alkylphenolica]|uniref:Uncharacterized protein n=1 Tax=Pseudomonas alkylphenolica TaxID=237609 RepID=A0A6I6HEN1_9PSED|nr:hypothetical protein [Pseudomonas alkylphenolica]QGW79265.1 hypothetical protein GPJ81_22060 [Pseudomonas alkylphenolica]